MIRRKPYDAEIEYLESTGTQWIAPGCIFKPTSKLLIDFCFTQRVSQQRIIGFDQSNGKARIDLYNSQNGGRISYTFGNNGSSANVVFTNYTTDRMVFSIDAKKKTIDYSIGGVTSTVAARNVLTQVDTEPNFFIGYCISADGTLDSQPRPHAKFYRLQFWEDADGPLVRDYIPVRVGTVGYMYDRVSGQLFGNQGTGAFVLGPDVSDGESVMRLHNYPKPLSAKDYIQDGLVAMWDGIENAGWGVYNQFAPEWKDLIGDKDAVLSNGAYFLDNRLVCIPDSYARIATTSSLWGTAECVFQPKFTAGNYDVRIFGGNTGYWDSARSNLVMNFAHHGAAQPSWRPQIISYNDHTLSLTSGWGNSLNPPSKPFSFSYGRDFGYVNGEKVDVSERVWGGYTRSQLGINMPNINNTVTLPIDYYCIRLYSRALTAAEVAHNNAIDKERFGL